MTYRHPEGAAIGRYRRLPVEVHQADPAATEALLGDTAGAGKDQS